MHRIVLALLLCLTASPVLAAIGSISGTVVNSVTGQPFPGENGDTPIVDLFLCVNGDCTDPYNLLPRSSIVLVGQADFLLTTTFGNGTPLDAGRYRVLVYLGTVGYSQIQHDIDVADHEHKDLGLLEIVPPPILFENVTMCDAVPSKGGHCHFSYDMVNVTSKSITVLTWQLATAFGHGSNIDVTLYQLPGEKRVIIKPGKRVTIRGRTGFPHFALDGAVMCLSAYVSRFRPAGIHFDTLNTEQLFCVFKGDEFLSPDA